jgi:hypothetical protein
MGSIERRTPSPNDLEDVYERRRYATLFYVLLFTLLVLPIATSVGLPAMLIKLLILGCLLAALMPNAEARNRLVLFLIVLLLVLARAASELSYLPIHPGYLVMLVGMIGLAAAGWTLASTIAARKVTSETIYAVLSTYLLAGIFFGQIYRGINLLSPESVVGPSPLTEQAAVYYSFVTLATLGYGDFLPRSDVARGVATFEVIGGQLFLAVLVARLIGAFEEVPRTR